MYARLATGVAILLLALTAHAQTSPAGGAAEPPQALQHKQALISVLLNDAQAVKRIEASQNTEAKRSYADARNLADKASAAMQTGNFAQAEQFLNEAIWKMSRARQLAPDHGARAAAMRNRFAELMNSIEGLLASYRFHAGRAVSGGQAAQEMEQVQALIERSRELARKDSISDAVRALEQAEHLLMRGLKRVLGARTLEYAQRFDSPAEEYAYELERNRSYHDLIPVALSELKPSAEARALIDRYVDQNRIALRDAAGLALRGDYAAGVRRLLEGTSALQRALIAAGLAMPQESR